MQVFEVNAKMHFRAKMVEAAAMKKFYSILQSVNKLTKICVMRLTSDKVYFIATDILGSGGHLPSGGPAIWCQLDQVNFFNEFKLGGVTADMVMLL